MKKRIMIFLTAAVLSLGGCRSDKADAVTTTSETTTTTAETTTATEATTTTAKQTTTTAEITTTAVTTTSAIPEQTTAIPQKTELTELSDGTVLYYEDISEKGNRYIEFDLALIRRSEGLWFDSHEYPMFFDVEGFQYFGETVPDEGFYTVRAGENLGNLRIVEAGIRFPTDKNGEVESYGPSANYIRLDGRITLTGTVVMYNYYENDNGIAFIPDSSYKGLPLVGMDEDRIAHKEFIWEGGGAYPFDGSGGYLDGVKLPEYEGKIRYGVYTEAPCFELGSLTDCAEIDAVSEFTESGISRTVRKAQVTLDSLYISWRDGAIGVEDTSARLLDMEITEIVGDFTQR